MSPFELHFVDSPSQRDDSNHLVWPSEPGSSGTITTDVDPWLSALGLVPTAGIDLVRIAVAALLADRLTARPKSFSRTLRIAVHVVDPEPWRDVLEEIADLLYWLTGDTWFIELLQSSGERPDSPSEQQPAVSRVALLSGGLDSFCGAVLAPREGTLFLGHWDNPTVKGSQNRAAQWLRDNVHSNLEYRQVRITQDRPKREASNRSRSLLFLSLASAAAAGRGASVAQVPENGFTSLNPPLGSNRGGALSTRSTHPETLDRLNRILRAVGLQVQIENPFQGFTKGQTVAAAATGVDALATGAALTLSCGKLDGRVYAGGNQNHHCGLCVPCLVRRGAFAAAGVADATPYLSEYLTGAALAKLRERRKSDTDAVRMTLQSPFDDEALFALGPFPATFDLDAALELCRRGFAELEQIALP